MVIRTEGGILVKTPFLKDMKVPCLLHTSKKKGGERLKDVRAFKNKTPFFPPNLPSQQGKVYKKGLKSMSGGITTFYAALERQSVIFV